MSAARSAGLEAGHHDRLSFARSAGLEAGHVIAVALLLWVSHLDTLALLFPVWVRLVSIEILRRGMARRPSARATA